MMLATADALADDPDPYTTAMVQATELERAYRPRDAARVLATIEGRYPQDYDLQLRLAWLNFQAARYDIAARYYRHALSLSPRSREARLGLAWTLLRSGRHGPARREFRVVLARWPEVASARKGLALTRREQRAPGVTFAPASTVTTHLYQGHPAKAAAVGSSASLAARILGRWRLGVSYELTHFWIKEKLQSLYGDGFEEHAVFLTCGLDLGRWSAAGHYAYVHDGSETLDYTHLLGLSALYSAALGDLGLELGSSLYPDMTVHRIAPSWRVPLLGWLSLSATVGVQHAAAGQFHPQLGERSETLFNTSFTILAAGRPGSLWAGGKVGDEVRPAYPRLAVVDNSLDRVCRGVWAGGELAVGAGWSIIVAYALAWLEMPVTPMFSYESKRHLLTVGAAWTQSRARERR
jgi:tetratricopeptide (TPR) repeat protein